MLAMLVGDSAMAANTFSQVPSALAAYGHYIGIILAVFFLAIEKALVKPGMTEEEEMTVVYADIAYGISAILIVIAGFFRLTDYGKGWDFYAHEPIFWAKMVMLTILGASSFFPTIKYIQRSLLFTESKKTGEAVPPMSPKLVMRIQKIINGELLAFLAIPLAATLMARGVAYDASMPWELGAAATGLSLTGFTIKYVKEAFDWKEDA
jgi:uncharacterized membrane protein